VIVQCPYCASRYRVEATRLAAPDAKLRCSRCQHVFPAPATDKRSAGTSPRAEKSAATRPERPPPATAESLTLPFEQASWKDEGDGENEARVEPVLTVPDTDEEYTLGTDGETESLTIDDEDEVPRLEEPPPVVPAPLPPAAPIAAVAVDPAPLTEPPPAPVVVSEAEPFVIDTGRQVRPGRKAREPVMADSDRGKMVAILWFVGAVTLGYAVLTAALFANPGLADQWFGNVPWIGSLRDDRALTRKITLSDVVGTYQRIKDGKDVFVISGKAMNTAPVPLQGVQIVGRLFDDEGRGMAEKVIHCGNVISTRVLKDLTPRELSVLQKLNPPSRFTIEPGASSTFVIVFMDPPKAAVSFSAQVVAAHRQA